MLLGIGALMALLYAVVCLMMWPYPQLVDNAGGGFAQVIQITVVLVVFTTIAGAATWLLQKRHRRHQDCRLPDLHRLQNAAD